MIPLKIRHTPEVLNRIIADVLRLPNTEPDSFIEWAIRKSLPLLTAEEANERIVELTLDLMRLQAALDAAAMREAPDEP